MTADEPYRGQDLLPNSYRRLAWWMTFTLLLTSRCWSQEIPRLLVPDPSIVTAVPPIGAPLGTPGEFFPGSGLPKGPNHPIGIGVVESISPSPSHYVTRRQPFSPEETYLERRQFERTPTPTIPSERSPAVLRETPPLHLVLHERFLNRFLEQVRFETGEVRDVIEGAQVYGVQGTQSQINLDVVPHPSSLAFRVLVRGNIHSQTSGYTPMAVVYTQGEQQFLAGKLVLFDGNQILTQWPQFRVSAQNLPVGAVTPLSRSWLLGPVSERVALRVAESKRPNTEAIARQRVVEQAGPRLNREIDSMLSKGNEFLQTSDFWAKLRSNRWFQGEYRSTEWHSHIALRPKTGTSNEAIRPPRGWVPEDRGATLFLHESFVAHGIDLANLSGKTISDRQLRRVLENLFSQLFELDYPPTPANIPEALRGVETEIEFAEQNPLMVQFDGDRIRIRVQCTLRPGGQKIIPPLTMEWEYVVVDRGTAWEFQPRNVRVNLRETSSMEAMVETLATSAVTAQLPTFVGQKTLDVSRFLPVNQVSPSTTVRFARLQLIDGWMILSLD